MAKPDVRCQCTRLGPGNPCTAPMTQEDLLCDACRNRDTRAGHLGTPQGWHFTIRNDRPGFPR